MDLKDLLLKTSAELNDDEKKFVKENEDKLSDEDKDAYSDFLNVQPDDAGVGTGAGDGSDDGNKGGGTGEGGDGGNGAGDGTPAPGADDKPAYVFKTEEEAQKFVRDQIAKNEADKQAAIDAAKTPEEKRYVEDNWKPENWNKGLNTIVATVKEELRQEAEAKAEKEAIEYWTNQWNELSTAKNLPSLETQEGKLLHTQVINLMRGYGKKTFAEGYELWEKVNGVVNPVAPTDAGAGAGGGADDAAQKAKDDAKAAADAKAKVEADRKKAAAKVGGANAGTEKPNNGTSVKPFASYEEMKKTSSRGILKDLQ
jgi:hypothetical protein